MIQEKICDSKKGEKRFCRGRDCGIFEKNKNGYLIGAATGGLTDTTGPPCAARQ
jgi:hypothetical protein